MPILKASANHRLSGRNGARHALVHDADADRLGRVALVEQAPLSQRDTHGLEVAGRRRSPIARQRVGRRSALERDAANLCADQRQPVHHARRFHSRHRRDRIDDLAAEPGDGDVLRVLRLRGMAR